MRQENPFLAAQKQFAMDQHAILVSIDLAGKVLHVNSRFCEISGYSYEELIDKKHSILFSDRHPKEFYMEMYSVLAAGQTWQGEIQCCGKDGNLFWIFTTIVPLKNTENEIEQYSVICTDISHQKKVEEELLQHQLELEQRNQILSQMKEELQENEIRQRFLLMNLEVGVVVHATDTSILICNPMAEELLGVKEDQVTGKKAMDPLWNFINEDNTPMAIEDFPVSRIKTTRLPLRRQILGINEPYLNDITWVMVNGFPVFDYNKEISQIVISFIDITEMKQSEFLLQIQNNEILTQNEELIRMNKELMSTEEKLNRTLKELETLNNTKDTFFKIIAHDLRNPFIGISGISEMMEKSLLEKKVEEWELLLHYAQLIKASSQSGSNLLDNLMQWALSQTGEMKVYCQNVPVKILISTVISQISLSAFKKNISIEEDMEDSNKVFADITLANTILRNLVSNAIKFTPKNGKIIIRTKNVLDFLEISVSDTGIGMSEKSLAKIFKIDSKFSNLGTENEKGTGLGLILCKEFVEKLGGQIWVNSQVGVGSTFTFSLPIGQTD